MNVRQASGSGKRWSEALLGGMAGLGARVLLAGAARLLGFKKGPVAVVGGVAGVVGALVGGGLARRQSRFELEPPAPEPEAHPPEERVARPLEEAAPRRGPNGRERFEWHEGGGRHELGRA